MGKKLKHGLAMLAEPIREFGNGINFPDSNILQDFINHKAKKYVKKHVAKLKKELIEEVEGIMDKHHKVIHQSVETSFNRMATDLKEELMKEFHQELLSSKCLMDSHGIKNDENDDKEISPELQKYTDGKNGGEF